MAIEPPYLLFLGDAADALAAKTARGIAHWRPERCLGQYRMQGCRADLGLPDHGIEDAARAGARTLVVGVANRGGVLSEAWVDVLEHALAHGMDVAAGLHARLDEVRRLVLAAERHHRTLHDVRHPKGALPVADGKPRPGKRLLTVGTDASVGKMYTALALEAELHRRGIDADFRATGQTGILISGEGVSVDAVVADFISGAAEWLTPGNEPEHWDVVEGQGSLFHPSFAGVSLGLLHGSQPDALVLCHEPTRAGMRGLEHYAPPTLETCLKRNEEAARLTNPGARTVGIAVNTAGLDRDAADSYVAHTERALALPTVDPVRHGVGRIVDMLP